MKDDRDEAPEENYAPQQGEGRLSDLVKALGGATAAGRVANVSRNTIYDWINERTKIPLSSATLLAEAANVSLDWLACRSESAVGSSLNSLDEAIIGSNTSYPLSARNRALSRIQNIKRHEDGDLVPDGFFPVPMLNVKASAGKGRASLPGDLLTSHQLLFSERWLRSLDLTPKDVELLQAQGDSMYPTIHDGDLMLVDRGYGEVVHGKIYALVVRDLVIVKRVHFLAGGGMLLLSDNDRYPSETIPGNEVEQLSFQGRVVWYGRAI